MSEKLEYWLDDDGCIACGTGDDYETIAELLTTDTKHAFLLTAAPDLLAALRLMLSDYRTEGCHDSGCLVCKRSEAAKAAARAAIAKATS